MSTKKNVVSLFSGCGGMDLGLEGNFDVLRKCLNLDINSKWIKKDVAQNWVTLEPTCFETIFSNDIRTGAQAAWESYFYKRGTPSGTFHLSSIVDLVKRQKEGGLIFPEKVDLITGGFPCQDFSLAGKRKGFSSHKSHSGNLLRDFDNPTFENRGMLYLWMKEVVDLLRPKMFIAENVKGLISLSDVKAIIENDFKKIGNDGYLVVNARVLNAAEFGVPQNRERVIFFGFRKDLLKSKALKALSSETIPPEYDPYPTPTHCLENGKDTNHSLDPFLTVRQALVGLDEPDVSNDLAQKNYSKAKFYGKHCQGQSEVNLAGVAPTIRAEHHGNIEFRRLTVEHGGNYQKELLQGLKERRLSVRECARIQTFPDDYEFVNPGSISASEAYKLIGNAVPPLLAYHIAKRVENLWSKWFLQKEAKPENTRTHQPELLEMG